MSNALRTAIAVALVAFIPSTAVADTVMFAGASLQLPDDGWKIVDEGKLISVLPVVRRPMFIEVYRFSKVPRADREVIRRLIAGRKNTTDVIATELRKTPDGLHAAGLGKIKGVTVVWRFNATKTGNHAVVGVSFCSRKILDPCSTTYTRHGVAESRPRLASDRSPAVRNRPEPYGARVRCRVNYQRTIRLAPADSGVMVGATIHSALLARAGRAKSPAL